MRRLSGTCVALLGAAAVLGCASSDIGRDVPGADATPTSSPADAGENPVPPDAGENPVPPDAGENPVAPDARPSDAAPVDSCAGDPCNGHGWCSSGACYCDPGYAGANCNSCDGVWQQVGASPLECAPTVLLDGTAGDDDQATTGTDADEQIRGLDGDDFVRGLDGSDRVNGNRGADTVNGNRGRDEVHGGAADDTVHGGSEDDVLFGGSGDDTLVGGTGNDRMIGGDGNDLVQGGDGDDRYMIDGLGNDTFDDATGFDSARCLPGVRITNESMQGLNRVLYLSTGGTVTILGDRVEQVLGCE